MKPKTDQNLAQDGELLRAVTLIQAHTHAGIDYNAGDIIDVNPVEYDWLLAQQLINSTGE